MDNEVMEYAVRILKGRHLMCKSYEDCDECELGKSSEMSCNSICIENTVEAIEIIETWLANNEPTYKDEFLKHFPFADIDEIQPCNVFPTDERFMCSCSDDTCTKCWNLKYKE